ncbi:regulator of volume decrease after cellular swelling-domain-containing protein [Crucibulum laeve]|uniref:Regulator of volume decrease after cellular swelling-domain-containing protein n=1 Tax=Crucibulum laeve TaxID=68775 RepID=A0A5C3M6F0_9AGAR|nr:regulator of volume decrease after cellular swelling-domain-containing protein [Crucibulum laeve]
MPSVHLIDAIPHFVSSEEHRSLVASTPVSFSDIPPVIRYKEDDVAVSIDPPLKGFSTEDAARGTLYVLTSVLAFMSTTGRGFQIEYPTITLHAISRGDTPSIYCQLDESATEEDPAAIQAEEDGVSDMRELSIVPRSPESLEPIFEALSQCASLHPDKHDDEDDLDDAFIEDDGTFETFTGDGDQELSEVGRVRSDFINDNRFAPY